jgi:hypothetical protein
MVGRDDEERLLKAQAALSKLRGLGDLISVAGQTEQADTVHWCGVGELLQDLHDDLEAVIDPGATQQRAEARCVLSPAGQGGEDARV